MNTALTKTTNTSAALAPITMSSLELVDFINTSRQPGEAQLTHDNLLKKVAIVLGTDAVKFNGIYRDSMNRPKPCYHFPKREACLMAMSYSYELQAKVYDKMTALEAQAAKPVPVAMTQMQMMLAVVKGVVDLEQKQIATTALLEVASARLDRLEAIPAGIPALDNLPAGAAGISQLRKSIKRAFGMTDEVVDFIVRNYSGRPIPFATVRNPHPEAVEATYLVWYSKEVRSAALAFIAECSRQTATLFAHPEYLNRRFKMTAPVKPTPATGKREALQRYMTP